MNGWLSHLWWYSHSSQDCVMLKNVPIVWVLVSVCWLHEGQVENSDIRHDSKTMYFFLGWELQ